MNTKSVMLLLCLLLAAAAVQTGCTKRIYEIEMTADGETLTRQITVSEGKPTPSKEFFEEHNALHDPVEHVYYPLPDEEKLMLQKLYPQQMTDTPDENILRFRGSFTGSTPQDVGGAGLLMHYETQMGSTGIYIERFRGENMAGHVTRGQQAADRLADLFIGWFESEMKADPRFPQLREWMDTQFRDDLKNLSVLTWAMSLRAQTSDEPQLGEIVPRIVQYLMERGYFTADDLPAMVRNIYAGEWGELGSITLILPPKMLARRMGIDAAEKLPDSLAFLSEPHRAAESFRRYVENTDAYKAELAEWEKARQADPPPPNQPPKKIPFFCGPGKKRTKWPFF